MYRGEQPVFTPPFKGQTFRFEGTAVDVEALLAEVPEGKEKTRPEVAEQAQADPVFRALEARGGCYGSSRQASTPSCVPSRLSTRRRPWRLSPRCVFVPACSLQEPRAGGVPRTPGVRKWHP